VNKFIRDSGSQKFTWVLFRQRETCSTGDFKNRVELWCVKIRVSYD